MHLPSSLDFVSFFFFFFFPRLILPLAGQSRGTGTVGVGPVLPVFAKLRFDGVVEDVAQDSLILAFISNEAVETLAEPKGAFSAHLFIAGSCGMPFDGADNIK